MVKSRFTCYQPPKRLSLFHINTVIYVRIVRKLRATFLCSEISERSANNCLDRFQFLIRKTPRGAYDLEASPKPLEVHASILVNSKREKEGM